MKKTQTFLFALAITMSFGINAASAQIYINIRPPKPVIVRSAPPGPHHVWIEEDWAERDGHYEYNGGHWAAPPHDGDRYQAGHWDHSKRGHSWRPGRWHH